jgi:hypothetical protein
MAKYTKEQLWDLYGALPEKLKEEMSSEENSNTVYKIGERNGLNVKNQYLLTKYVGYSFLGILPPDDMSKVLVKDLKINKKTAETIGQELSRLLFFPLRELFSKIYSPIVSKENIPQEIKENDKKPKEEAEKVEEIEESFDPYKEEF